MTDGIDVDDYKIIKKECEKETNKLETKLATLSSNVPKIKAKTCLIRL